MRTIICISPVNEIPCTLATRGRSNINSLGLMPRFKIYELKKTFLICNRGSQRLELKGQGTNSMWVFIFFKKKVPVEKVDCATRSHLSESLLSWTALCYCFYKTNFLASLRFHAGYNHTKDDYGWYGVTQSMGTGNNQRKFWDSITIHEEVPYRRGLYKWWAFTTYVKAKQCYNNAVLNYTPTIYHFIMREVFLRPLRN